MHRPRRRDRVREILRLPSRAPAPSGNAPSGSQGGSPVQVPATSLHTPSLRTPSQRFLDATQNKLSRDEKDIIRKHLAPDTHDIGAAVHDAYKAALIQKQVCESKRWKWTFRGTEIKLRDKAESVLIWLDRFKSVGDVVANVDPLHVGLPWAGIRILLEMTVSESHQMATLLAGMDLTLSMANRLDAYFSYFQRLPATPTTDNFEQALIQMYAQVLQFIATAIQSYSRGAPSRTWHALWEASSLDRFEQECDRMAIRTEIEASNCDRELTAQRRHDARHWRADLDQTLQQLNGIQSIKGALDTLHAKADLTRLTTAAGAMYNSYEDEHTARCLADTRVDLLNQISAWAHDLNGKTIFWLCGMAGTGKSTIARTVAHKLDKQGCLGASFFFKRGEADRQTARRFFPTIVRQLIDFIPSLAQSVAHALDKDSYLCERTLQDQFEELLLHPFSLTPPAQVKARGLVIVIDALDECERSSEVRTILKLLSRVDSLGLLRLRIFVTSRGELPIQIGFRSMDGSLHEDLVLEEVQTPTIEHDVRAFFNQKFTDIKDERLLKRPFDALPSDWPTEADIQALVALAVPLFIFAATICRFVAESSPQKRLNLVLQQNDSRAYSGLGKTYLPILEQIMAEKDEEQQNETIANFKKIVGSIVLVADPLSATSLSSLLQLDRDVIYDHLEHLHSVLQVPHDSHLPVRPLHLSFRDFLVDPMRKDRDRFWIDRKQTHGMLARHCLELLSQPGLLSRDLCHLVEPGIRRADVCWQIVASYIPPDVAYATQFWTRHVSESKEELLDDGKVLLFLQTHFLHWLEALTWLGQISSAIASISELRSQATGMRIAELLDDALRFVLRNRNIIDIAPLQLYSSAIAFAPTESVISTLYMYESRKDFDLFPSAPLKWGAEVLEFGGHSESVTSIAFSPDGQVLASKSLDKTIRLWNAQTGEEKQRLKALRLGDIAFSTDGQTLTSASYVDNGFPNVVLQVWNAHTGEQVRNVGNSFGSCASSKMSAAVAFSPDGLVVAIACHSWIIKLFDVQTGELKQVLEGYVSTVVALLFLPDGKAIESVAADGTVQRWDIASGIRTHKIRWRGDHSIVNISLAPDGQIIAVSSEDGTVRLWRPFLDQQQTQELKGHKGPVTSVAFSSDQQFLASASLDQTVRLWHILTGERTGQIGEVEWELDRNNPVMAMSPTEQVVAVSICDRILELWDIQTGKRRQALQGHYGKIDMAAFSPDGLVVISAGYDMTMRLWDTQTGEAIQVFDVSDLPRQHLSSIAVSVDRKMIASESVDEAVVLLWDAQAGKFLRVLQEKENTTFPTTSVPGACLLATTSYSGMVRLWNTQTGTKVSELGERNEELCSGSLSLDGQCFVTMSANGSVRLWNADEGELLRHFSGLAEDSDSRAIISPDQRIVAWISNDGSLQLWDVQTGEQTQRIESSVMGLENLYGMRNIAFSPTSYAVAISICETVQLYDLQTGKQTWQAIKHESIVLALSFSRSGQMLATGSMDLTIRLLNVETGNMMQVLDAQASLMEALAFSPNGQSLASGSLEGAMHLWSTETPVAHQKERHSSFDRGVAVLDFSPDGQVVASAIRGGTLRLWDARTGEEKAKREFTTNNFSIALSFSPDSQLVALANNRAVLMWDARTGEEKMELESRSYDSFVTLSFSPDNQLVASANSSAISVWIVHTGKLTHRLETKGSFFTHPIVAFSPNSQMLAYLPEFDQHLVRIWDLQTDEPIQTFTDGDKVIGAMSFSPDNCLVACMTGDGLDFFSVQSGDLTHRHNLPRDGRRSEESLPLVRTSNEQRRTFSRDGKYVHYKHAAFLLDWTGPDPQRRSPNLEPIKELELSGPWIRSGGRDILYLHMDYQGACFATFQNILAIGQDSGEVLFFRLSERSP